MLLAPAIMPQDTQSPIVVFCLLSNVRLCESFNGPHKPICRILQVHRMKVHFQNPC